MTSYSHDECCELLKSCPLAACHGGVSDDTRGWELSSQEVALSAERSRPGAFTGPGGERGQIGLNALQRRRRSTPVLKVKLHLTPQSWSFKLGQLVFDGFICRCF